MRRDCADATRWAAERRKTLTGGHLLAVVDQAPPVSLTESPKCLGLASGSEATFARANLTYSSASPWL